jgi:hypothetical protein
MSNTTSVHNPILAARKISPLRQRMIDDMTVRNFAPNTILCYLKQVSYFAQHFGKSPDHLGPEEIRTYPDLFGQGEEGWGSAAGPWRSAPFGFSTTSL